MKYEPPKTIPRISWYLFGQFRSIISLEGTSVDVYDKTIAIQFNRNRLPYRNKTKGIALLYINFTTIHWFCEVVLTYLAWNQRIVSHTPKGK